MRLTILVNLMLFYRGAAPLLWRKWQQHFRMRPDASEMLINTGLLYF